MPGNKSGNRTFQLVSVDGHAHKHKPSHKKGKKRGHSATTQTGGPHSATHKLANNAGLCKGMGGAQKKNCASTVVVRETTQGSKHKVYTYRVSRKSVHAPLTRKNGSPIKSKNGKPIVFKHRYHVKSLKA